MKILVFGGGLGNQIFEYGYYKYLVDKLPKEKIYGYYPPELLSEHYGLELNKWFTVDLPKQKWFVPSYYQIIRIIRKVFGINSLIETDTNCSYENASIIFALKTNKLYLPQSDWLRWNVDEQLLSNNNKNVLEDIRSSDSFFMHVRKGDYLSSQYKDRFEGTCPVSYYQSAIDIITRGHKDVHFFIFSDDLNWAKENISIGDSKKTYVDWNTGDDSPLDMYLMSNCKGGIMANSTFSYWGAISGRKDKEIYCPKQWFAKGYAPTPNIFLSNWVQL